MSYPLKQDEILQTKLFVPPLRPFQVKRPRLLQKLNRGLHCKLTLVSASAGFGKTTIVADWLQQVEHTAAWLSLDVADNDPARFLTYLVASLQTVLPNLGQAVGPQSQLQSLTPFMIGLINEFTAVSHPVLFVLDDYHLIQNPLIHEAMEFLLKNQPPNFHLVITTREDPPFALPRLRMRSQLVELRQQDLRFTPSETAEFLNQSMHLNLTAANIEALELRTEGWIAGLQLAALAIQTPPEQPDRPDVDQFITQFSGSNRYVIDYLVEEVIAQQPEDIQQFLRKTAVCDRFCADLCDALLEDGQSSKTILRTLESANLFLIPLDDRREWFRYHHLFAEFLLTEMPPTDTLQIHQKAARWFAHNGLFREAIEHALLGSDFVHAELWIVENASQLLRSGELSTLLAWIDKLPEGQQSAQLATLMGWSAWLMGQGEQAAAYAQVAFAQTENEQIPGELLALQACLVLVQDNSDDALRLAQAAVTALQEGDPFFRNMVLMILAEAQNTVGDLSGAIETLKTAVHDQSAMKDPFTVVGSAMNLAQLLDMQGRRSEAMQLCEEMIASYSDHAGRPFPMTGLAFIMLGTLKYHANELQEAEQLVLQGMQLGAQFQVAGVAMSGQIMLANLYLALDRPQEALLAARTMRQLVEQADFAAYVAQALAVEANVQAMIGNWTAVSAWAEAANLAPTDKPDFRHDLDYMVYARLLIAKSRHEQAAQVLRSLANSLHQAGRVQMLITVAILQSILLSKLGQDEDAQDKMALAIELAAPELYLRPFLNEGKIIYPTLKAARETNPQFVDALLNHYDVARNQDLVEALSERELEVLQLVAEGHSNRETAEKLVVTEGTIKKHLNNVYGKLGVKNRTQAINLARELQIIA